MALSSREVRALRRIECGLSRDSPDLAGLMRSSGEDREAGDRVDLGGLNTRMGMLAKASLGVGVLLILLGVVVGPTSVTVAGVLVIVLFAAPLFGAARSYAPRDDG